MQPSGAHAGPLVDHATSCLSVSFNTPKPASSTGEASATLYDQWTQNREVSSFGTNDGSAPLAFQSWHHFKEAFPPELIKHAVDNSDVQVKHCFDPFGGSGTTALACQMLGISSTTVEVNPFLADVIRAKLSSYDVDDLISDLAQVRHKARKDGPDPRSYFAHTPPSFLEPGLRGRWIFDIDVAERLAAILHAIDELPNPDTRRLFYVIVGGLLAQVSNVVVSGKGRRYRRNWTQSRMPIGHADALFAQRAQRAVLDIRQFSSRIAANLDVIEGDSRTTRVHRNYQLSVMSPPYPNSFDYTDVYNLELWMLGYLRRTEDNRKLRTATLSSHVQLSRTFSKSPQGSPTLAQTLDKLTSVKSRLWSPWIPSMVGSYFADLLEVLENVGSGLQEDSKCWMVVGDSSYSGINIRVAQILTELAPHFGWHVVESVPFRHMKSSAQQGWRAELAESLLVLRKG